MSKVGVRTHLNVYMYVFDQFAILARIFDEGHREGLEFWWKNHTSA